MHKYFLTIIIAFTALLFLFNSGCVTDSNTNENEDFIDISILGFDTLAIRDTGSIGGTVTSSEAIDENAFTFTVLDSGGDTVTGRFNINFNDINAGTNIDIKNDLNLKISTNGDTTFGTYVFQLSASNGTMSSMKYFQFHYTSYDSVNLEIVPFDSLIPFRTVNIGGTCKAYPAIDENAFSISIIQELNIDVTDRFIITSMDIALSEEISLESDLQLTITPTISAIKGPYTFRLTVTAGIASLTKNVPFKIIALENVELKLGSILSPTYGATLDADIMRAFITADAAAYSEKMDIWYSNDIDSNNVFYSIKAAALAQYPPRTWQFQNETKMAFVSTAFDSVVLQSEIDSIWATVQDSAKKQVLRPLPGDIIILETDEQRKCLFKFIYGDGTPTGSATIHGKRE